MVDHDDPDLLLNMTFKKISTIKPEDCEDLRGYLSAFKEYSSTLVELGAPLHHKLQVSAFRAGLPKYLQDELSSLSQQGVGHRKELSLDFITCLLEDRVSSDNALSKDTVSSDNQPRRACEAKGAQWPYFTLPENSVLPKHVSERAIDSDAPHLQYTSISDNPHLPNYLFQRAVDSDAPQAPLPGCPAEFSLPSWASEHRQAPVWPESPPSGKGLPVYLLDRGFDSGASQGSYSSGTAKHNLPLPQYLLDRPLYSGAPPWSCGGKDGGIRGKRSHKL